MLREAWPAAESFAKKFRTPLSLLSTTFLAVLIWQAMSGARDILLSSQAVMVVAVILLSVGVHVFYLAVNYLVICHLMKTEPFEAIAIVIVGSQKSAPVAGVKGGVNSSSRCSSRRC